MDMVEKVNITWWAHIVIFKDQQSGHERQEGKKLGVGPANIIVVSSNGMYP